MSAVKALLRRLCPRPVRNWLRAPAKSLAWGWRQTRYLAGARELREVRPGWAVVCHPLAYRHSYFAQLEDPEQAAEFDAFVARCFPGMVLFDLGAHFGLFSLAALHYGGPAARAVAVDASPTAERLLRIQAELNGVADRMQVVRACVCDAVGVREMVAVGVLADGYFTAPGPDHGRETSPTPAVTLDHLARQTGLRPTHVKIDVEGFEASVLDGGAEVLRGDPAPLVFLELHNDILRGRGEDPAEVLGRLARLGYRVVDAHAGAPGAALTDRPLVRLVARRD
jgi:FkbM family methyltransferase